MSPSRRELSVVPLFIACVWCFLGLLGSLLVRLLALPVRLSLPAPVRYFGLIPLALAIGFLIWILRYRKFHDVVVSTYLTLRMAITGGLKDASRPRDEPLIVQGPQRHVRNPMYFAVVCLILGLWLLLDYTFLLFLAGLFVLWFNLVLIPIEQRELRALFGQEFEAYRQAVPRFIPSFKPRWK